MKRFVFASLFYLGVAAVLGMVNGFWETTYFGLFAHTHFSLLGFMAMIVFGIGYFILPRFNGTDLRFPQWVPVHFWLANITLVGMVVFRGLSVETGEDAYRVLFILSAAGQALSLLMFVTNIWMTLSTKPGQQVAATAQSAPSRRTQPTSSPSAQTTQQARHEAPTVTADTKIADLVDAAPSVKDVLVAAGLKSLAMPGHIDQVRAMGVTLGMAAGRHGLDLNDLINKIEQELRSPSTSSNTLKEKPQIPTAETVDGSLLIGTVMEQYPETRTVFQKYFGAGCFDCPGQMYESIDMACRMHGVDQQTFLKELNSAIHNA
jgi:hybrid cluster-associated redox disulfide protein